MARTPQKPKGDTSLPLPEFFWTPEQIAAFHQITRATVFSAIERGDMEAYKPFGNVVRISDSAYRNWLNSTRIKK